MTLKASVYKLRARGGVGEQPRDSPLVSPMQWGCCDGHSPRSFEEAGFSPVVPFLIILQPAAGFVSAPVEGDSFNLSLARATRTSQLSQAIFCLNAACGANN